MNLQDLVDSRIGLSYEQEESLLSLLCFNQRVLTQLALKKLVRYHFYSVFDSSWFSKELVIKDNVVKLISSGNIKLIRAAILGGDSIA